MDRGNHFLDIYHSLFKHYGPQHWWPGETPFEVIIGAILTQNTSWDNVEKAIDSLKSSGRFTPEGLFRLPTEKLALLIKSSGYFNIKARRLKNFLTFLFDDYDGEIDLMIKEDGPVLRHKLLGVNGIGPETADSILLYAAGHPVFVIDAYTKRIFSRHSYIDADATYHQVQELFMGYLPHDLNMYNEYHALIVRVGKELCRTTPNCEACPVEYDLHKKGKNAIR